MAFGYRHNLNSAWSRRNWLCSIYDVEKKENVTEG